MEESYYDQLKEIRESDDSIWPEWLFRINVADYGDNYIERSVVSSVEATEVMKLRRRYNDYHEWVDAMEVYEEYMESLYEKYGSKRMVKNSIKSGTIEDPIPNKPKLKTSRKNKTILKTGQAPARRLRIIRESLEEIHERSMWNHRDDPDREVDQSGDYKMHKESKKILKKMDDNHSAKERKKNLFRSDSRDFGSDFVVEFLNNQANGYYDKNGYRKEFGVGEGKIYPSFTKAMKAYEKGKLDEEEKDRGDFLMDNYAVRQRRLEKKENVDKEEFYKDLMKNGYNVRGMVEHSGMDKKAVKMFASKIGLSSAASKKDMKKMKKRIKKDRKKMKRRMAGDRAAERILTGNRLDVLPDENGYLNMRLRDLQ